MSLKAIKTKIRSVGKTRQVTKAMEAVSAVKMRKSQQKAFAGRAYARAAAATLARVSGSRALATHPLTQNTGHAPRTLYIVITSDKGLAGALNSSVLRRVAQEIERGSAVIAIGRKANDFFTNRGYEVTAYHPNGNSLDSSFVHTVVGEAADQFLSKKISVVKIVYQNFISTFEQRPTVRTLFPLSLEELQKVVSDIVPTKGKYSEAPNSKLQISSYTVEPSEEKILAVILPKLAGVIVYHALLESRASEHSARMVAMKSASDKATELTHSLTLQFNKARQAAITREVSEITGGMEAMAS